MHRLFELAKIEKYQLDWFLQSLRSLKLDIPREILDQVASIHTLLNSELLNDHNTELYIEDEHDVVLPINSKFSIMKVRDSILMVHLLLINKFKLNVNELNEELEGRGLTFKDSISPEDFDEIFKSLYMIQKEADACESIEKSHLDRYHINIQACLAEMFPLLVEMNRQYQSTDVWNKNQLDNYLSQLDLNFVDKLIDFVEDLVGDLNDSRYEGFCEQYNCIKDLPHTDLIRMNLTSISKEIMSFFRDSCQLQSKKIHEMLLDLADASVQYKQLEAESMLDIPFLFIDDVKGGQDEDFQSTPLKRIKELTSIFKKHLLLRGTCFSTEHHIFPDSKMTPLADFSRANCLRFIEEYEQIQDDKLAKLKTTLRYSSASNNFKLDMQNAIFLSSALSPWKIVPAPSVKLGTHPLSLFSSQFKAIDNLTATSSHADIGPMNF